MTTLAEGDLHFTFEPGCVVSKYDGWAFYRRHFTHFSGGCKAVDFLCIHDHTAWLIEVKDYRRWIRGKPSSLCDEVAAKVRDTLAGLAAARVRAENGDERDMARMALECRWRVALHVEQRPRSGSWHQSLDPANLQLDLERAVRPVDAHPLVVNMASSTRLWTVGSS